MNYEYNLTLTEKKWLETAISHICFDKFAYFSFSIYFLKDSTMSVRNKSVFIA